MLMVMAGLMLKTASMMTRLNGRIPTAMDSVIILEELIPILVQVKQEILPQGGILGCPDADGDGWADSADAFPTDDTQYSDQDGDGYGDNITGNSPDSCPLTYGNSTIDRLGCVDTDGDGHSDLNDDFPNDPTRYLDTDNDGYDDAEDDCPTSPGTSTNGASVASMLTKILGQIAMIHSLWTQVNGMIPIWTDTETM